MTLALSCNVPHRVDVKKFQQRLDLHDDIVVLVRHMRLRAQEQNLVNNLKQRVHPWVGDFEHGGLISLAQDFADKYNDDLPLLVEVAL